MKHHTCLAASLTLFLATACAIIPNAAAPDAPPNTDIYIADLSTIDGNIWLGQLQPVAVSEGYDNQPAFLPGGNSLLYTSVGPSGKTDLWQRDLLTGTARQVTNTPDRSEYSPRLTPDRQAVSFIQEDPSGEVTEVYSQPLSGQGASPVITLKPLGYYAFLGQGTTVLTFLRSEPASLQRVDVSTGKTKEIANNIGRALYAPAHDQTAFFTTALENEAFQVHRYNDSTGETEALFKLPEGTQDYAVFQMPTGSGHGFFCADGTNLLFRTDRSDDAWQQVANFTLSGISSITRLAVNETATRIALVTQNQP